VKKSNPNVSFNMERRRAEIGPGKISIGTLQKKTGTFAPAFPGGPAIPGKRDIKSGKALKNHKMLARTAQELYGYAH
jgi:hypothetical protein